MKITRTTKTGETITITLTADELYTAYCEKQHEYDTDAVRSYMEEEDIPTEHADEIAYVMRKMLDNMDTGIYEHDAARIAVEEYLGMDK